jgi:hypothetical protein
MRFSEGSEVDLDSTFGVIADKAGLLVPLNEAREAGRDGEMKGEEEEVGCSWLPRSCDLERYLAERRRPIMS